MATDNGDMVEVLLRDRIAKLERTLHAYDGMLNTRAADAMRKRNTALERVLFDLLRGGLLPEAKRREVEITLGNKFQRKY